MAISIFDTLPIALTTQRVAPQTSTFGGGGRVNLATGDSDAVDINIQRATRDDSRSSQDALRRLSDASSVVSIAQTATDNIELLIDKATSIASQLTYALNPTTRTQLSNEAASILSEIDTIVSTATFNNQSVVSAGEQVFEIDISASDFSSETNASIQVLDVAISRSDLLINNLTASDFNNNAASTKTTLQNANVSLNLVRDRLDDAENEIDAVAERIGDRAFVQRLTQEEQEDFEEESGPEALAEQVVEAIDQRVAQETNQLDPLRVADLLADIETPQPAIEQAEAEEITINNSSTI